MVQWRSHTINFADQFRAAQKEGNAMHHNHTDSATQTQQAQKAGAPAAQGSIARAMLSTHPAAGGQVPDPLAVCIESCFACAMTCTACADACLAEADVANLRHCIRVNLDCADVCVATARVLSRLLEPSPRIRQELLHACLAACIECGEVCGQHAAHHEHCKVCADTCRHCADACQYALDLFANAGG